MKVITLLENRTISKEYKCKHGLSLYIETSNHKILFDTGTDDSFVQNACKLGVNLEDIDIAVISHGHYDHGGGLEAFLKCNSKAKIYIQKSAFDKHLIKLFKVVKYNIGLNKKLIDNNRFEFVDNMIKIDNELVLLGNVQGDKLIPKGNDKLLKENRQGLVVQDDFEHEISLLINDQGKYSLFCGCAHKGIVNIIERTKDIIDNELNTVIGGFHLMGMNIKKSESKKFLDDLSSMLIINNIDKYYTCHCTGEQAYSYLSQKMKNLDELKTGKVIEI
ncbi:7,8-dihydropterin-6-yl-methyl-4-(beta-D-ribofuranosyl)aminobenzene 5'-phosphate synthase [Natranaerovirga hydrolytica]|uniref:7, 8-dihydropterin-6-yl-methyl-4-(Beta-D-ribofuranosyl)aminobenzene 5'-phosphate synthase n=1 Tax=Natranaerovirga hydrolytica TaxID=680378 RepID=A0A4R1MJL0_9FIRM|nr:MBL fold metallo-hydrolase [Natranaerovirga hydrolytica]TCK92687.1 7,8-dihydropterin-6-yl-methyl-4-(beta-D-ribofuranosyl)aminobenzene 5'-phosphate synthase [Natranaerovirga hydrolytica]